jgi:hypothetical protein
MSVIGVDKRRIGLWLTKTEIVFALVEPDGHVVVRGRVPRGAWSRRPARHLPAQPRDRRHHGRAQLG